MSLFFNILIHDRLLPKIKGMAGELRQGVQKCCERLQFGYWGNGTRVKLLHGVNRLVYEARVNRGTRLLFTAARMPVARPPYEAENHLLIWDVVGHDSVNRVARLNLQPETGFLDFAEIAGADIVDPPVTPAIQPPAAEPFSAELLTQLLSRRDGASEVQDESAASVRWFELTPDIITDPAEWQALLDAPETADLELKLSLEQAQTVFAPGPVVLRGTAGSGKTTVSVYRLARLCVEQRGSRILYITYSPALLNTVRHLFRDLFAARRQAVPELGVEFLTFPELYRRLAGGTNAADTPVVRFPLFAKWYRGVYAREDAGLAWEEIRGIIKGACRDPDRDHLSLQKYEELGRKRAPLFIGERPRLYKVFEKYRDWCRQEQRCDDIDLARRAWCAGRQVPHPERYDQVICDEGQDLTEIEMALLLTLRRHWDGLFFTADPQQIVNPSGFRWAELRSLLREENPGLPLPELRGLSRNYRSVQSIVALANVLIRLQRERTGRTDDDEYQETQLQGAAPVLVHGAESEVLNFIRGFGPRCAVIAATDPEAERLARLLGSERVFSIPGAKGLEFDACVLWNLLSEDLATWRTILGDPAVSLKDDPGARRAIRYVYVGVTRARRYLGVFEAREDAAALWRQSPLRTCIEADAPEALAKFMVLAASPADWEREGEYFQARARYRQAAECYRRAGNAAREQENLGLFYESVEDYGQAVRAFREAGRPLRLAACLERAGEKREAARIFGQQGKWPDAGRLLEALKDYAAALEAYHQAGDAVGQGRCQLALLVARHDFLGAARLAGKLGDGLAAAGYFDRAGHHREAAALRLQNALATGDHAAAARLHETGGDLGQAVSEYRAAGDHLAAGRLLEKSGDFVAAAAAFRQAGTKGETAVRRCEALAAEGAGDWLTAEQGWKRLGNSERAAVSALRHLEASGEWQKAAAVYERRGDTPALLNCLARTADPQAELWLKALRMAQEGRKLEAAEAYETAQRYADADSLAAAFIKQFDVGTGSWAERRKADGIRGRCRLHLLWESGRKKEALASVVWRGDRKTLELHLDLCVQAQEWRRAAKDCEALNDWGGAEKYCTLAGDRKSLPRIRALSAEARGDLSEAACQWELAGRKTFASKARALAAEKAGDWQNAADFYTQARMAAQARRCRARLTASLPEPDTISRRPRRRRPAKTPDAAEPSATQPELF